MWVVLKRQQHALLLKNNRHCDTLLSGFYSINKHKTIFVYEAEVLTTNLNMMNEIKKMLHTEYD